MNWVKADQYCSSVHKSVAHLVRMETEAEYELLKNVIQENESEFFFMQNYTKPFLVDFMLQNTRAVVNWHLWSPFLDREHNNK